MGSFRRSGRFGIIGVFVVMAACAVITLNMLALWLAERLAEALP